MLVEHIPTAEHGEVHLIIADDDTEDDLTYNDLPWIEQVVGLAVAGRIQVLEGRGRRRVEFLVPDGTRRSAPRTSAGAASSQRLAGADTLSSPAIASAQSGAPPRGGRAGW